MKWHNDIQQGSDEWHKLRLGRFTASKFSDLFSKKDSATYNNLINDIVYERITGETPESYTTEWMERGTELEPYARQQYELDTFEDVETVGFATLNGWVGVSPDGLVGDKGLTEIKCPKHTTLINQHLSGRIPKQYYWQMQGQMWVCERDWCDYFVYYPNLKPFIKRVQRNNKDILKLMREIVLAKNEVKRRIDVLCG